MIAVHDRFWRSEHQITMTYKGVQQLMIYLIRHGQTALNKTRALQGRSDNPLNETGEEQARAVGAWFRDQGIAFTQIFTSPLIRAVQTAHLVAGSQVPLTVDERLIEMDYGPYEGINLKDPPPEIITFFSDFVHNPAPEGMEQLSEVVARLGDFLEDLRPQAGEGNILLSAHAISMKGVLEYLNPASKGAWWSTTLGNCALFRIEYKDGEYTIPEQIFIK